MTRSTSSLHNAITTTELVDRLAARLSTLDLNEEPAIPTDLEKPKSLAGKGAGKGKKREKIQPSDSNVRSEPDTEPSKDRDCCALASRAEKRVHWADEQQVPNENGHQRRKSL